MGLAGVGAHQVHDAQLDQVEPIAAVGLVVLVVLASRLLGGALDGVRIR